MRFAFYKISLLLLIFNKNRASLAVIVCVAKTTFPNFPTVNPFTICSATYIVTSRTTL